MGESVNTGFLYILTEKAATGSNLTLSERRWEIELFEIRQDSAAEPVQRASLCEADLGCTRSP